MKSLLTWVLAGLLVLLAGCSAAVDADPKDIEAVRQRLHAQFDKPEVPLTVEPVSVVGDHAVAGWTQGDNGGRALLKRSDGGWKLLLCAGDGLRDADLLRRAGLPAADARRLARQVQDAEGALSAERRQQLGRFQGVVRMDASGHHPPVHDSAGGWRLDATTSRLTFVSIKNNTVAESHRFTDIAGGATSDGQLTLRVALDSVETGIGIRDQRMRDLLFETGRYPQATVTLTVDSQAMKALAPGEHRIVSVQATLDLHGISNRLPAEVRVTRLDELRWLVTSEQPVLVNATNFGLINGIDALRRAAGLQAIGSGVPVSFALSMTSVPAGGGGALEVGEPWVREVPPGAGAAAGYGEFRNRSDRPVRIARLQSPLSQRVEIHEMAMVDGQMRMRAVEDLSIAPGGTLSLKPGGYHLMFMGLNRAPKAGETTLLTVELEDGESVEITLPVRKALPGAHDSH